MREKREELNRGILRDEEEKAKIQKVCLIAYARPPISSYFCYLFIVFQELSILSDRLSRINDDLARKMQARNEFDQTIQETEAAYMKILESSQTLLNVLRRETTNLTRKKNP